MERVRVAVVEDDAELRDEILVPLLRAAGFEATGMPGALALYRDLVASRYDVVLLDVGLPDEDGFAIARHLREAAPTIGLVMLTGYVSNGDRLRGLEAGVDAYLTKPVEASALIATLRNLSRRVATADGGDGQDDAEGWRLDERGWNILLPDGRAVELTLAEQQVMRRLAGSPGQPVRREDLIAGLADDVHEFDPHRLEMLVYRLRRKCQDSTGIALPLRSVRGVGYVLTW
ncbi:response regulator transcription factor [Luteimonas sp. FCS-9]|uniref:response regulator transcription factor n=1 Tax=Luteimonas sp. FCS-9 TaxID=1547516 RepID=UPI0018CEC510|nr:response regulator transcription factor [Luteimonas sp. FCS-9]